MSKFRVYLAGGISGLSYGDATDWREAFKAKVDEMSNGRIECLSPMRGKREYLKDVTSIGDNYGHVDWMASGLSITSRDRFDCKRSDAVVFNFLGASRVSIGTCIELGWADDGIKPRILVMEKPVQGQFKMEQNLHEHSMVRYCTNFHTDNLEDAADALCRIFLP
jgi:hypothetical protein